MATKKKKTATKTVVAKPATTKKPKSTAKRNAALEDAILRDLDDPKAWLVYGDWLQSEGDPRGELVTIQTSLEAKKSAKLTNRAKEILAQHHDALPGPLREYPKTLDRKADDAFEMRRGFVYSLRMSYQFWGYKRRKEDEQKKERKEKKTKKPKKEAEEKVIINLPALLGEILAHPSCAFVQEIVLGEYYDDLWDTERGSGQVYEELVDVIVKAKPRALRRLIVGDYDYPDDTEISWTYIGKLDKVWKTCPRLEVLSLQGGQIDLGKIDAPNLRVLSIETGGLPRKAVQQVAKAKFPKLESLQIFFGSSEYGAGGKLADIRPILDGKNLPKVKHLGLMNSEFADDLAREIGKAKILGQLETLDLSLGVMSDEGARSLVASAKAFKRLTELDLSENYIEAESKELKTLAKKVNLKNQRTPDEEGGPRYVSVGE
jgi:uncharacterized protein (TIGR02996 family)